ncbi:ABC transporter permease [Lentilactobacillus hilgardii]|uniref:ABC transporter permease n=1 Tax=Lentilactobacillus hilgardii TaxID=1588 RepID=UPI0021A6C57A|nr:ABC transporter permease [Lentilactobacillus hilgardii]MCT3399658.1 ABC transporter permease [Lentilactobacillus hilgardii]
MKELQARTMTHVTKKNRHQLIDYSRDFLIFFARKGFAAWVLLIIVWAIAAKVTNVSFLPGPLQTFAGAKELIRAGTLQKDLVISLLRIISGWLIGTIIAVPLGLVIGQFKLIRWLFEPLINFFRFVPAIGFLTLFLLWFGVGEISKVALIIYATMFPIIINTITGVLSIDPIKIESAQSQGASKFQIFYSIVIPSSIPSIFTGVRLGLGGAIIAIVAAEMLAAQQGIGYLIYTSRLYYRTDWIFVGIFILGIIGYLSDTLLRVIGNSIFKKYGVVDGHHQTRTR